MIIIAPTTCPSCGTELTRVNDQLFCTNKVNCPAQTSKKLQNFCKKLKIKGFGEATIEKLGITSIVELVELTAQDFLDAGFSEKMSDKLLKVIRDRLEEGISANDFLAAVSIPLIGDGAMRKLPISSIESITAEQCKAAGLGDKATSNLMTWISTEYPEYSAIYPWLTIPKQKKQADSKGITVCITGKLTDFKNRTEAAEFLTARGFEVKSSVTKAVNYLICEDGTTGSSYKKAISNNITITTIKELLEDN